MSSDADERLQAPAISRAFVHPLRQWGLLLALAVLPLLAVVKGDEQARRSVLHVLVSFVLLMLAFRVLGKRELSRLSPFELVTLMLIPEILSNSVQGQKTLLQGAAGLSTILSSVLLVSLVAQRSPKAQRLLESSPTVLVLDGRMLEREMNRERITPDELLSEMRKQGLGSLEKVHLAVLESSGNITFVANAE